jgi:transcriptional regulator with GAF, ATPase, and Fis domain
MALDTLSQELKTECCWVQTINTRKRTLSLVAQRGFSQEMKNEMTSLDIGHRFSEQVIGLGNEIVVPDLTNDGLYGLSSFSRAGFKWLVAAPLMTYRVHGVLGIASRNKKRFYKETTDLTKLIAGLIGTALNKAWLSQKPAAPEKTPPVQEKVTQAPEKKLKKTLPVQEKNLQSLPPAQEKTPPPAEPPELPQPPSETLPSSSQEKAFRKHARRMKSFRISHG